MMHALARLHSISTDDEPLKLKDLTRSRSTRALQIVDYRPTTKATTGI